MTTSFVGAYVYFGTSSDGSVIGFPGDTTFDQACTDWSSAAYFNRAIAARRHYFGGSIPTAVPRALTDDIAAGRRCDMSFNPPIAGSASARTALDSFLSACVTAGLSANVALWHEPYGQGLTTTQYASMIAYYGPTVRKYYWLWQNSNSSPIASGKITASTYFNACALGSFDGISYDIYAPSYSKDTSIIGKFDTAASAAGLPLGIWEFGGNSNQNTVTEITDLFNAIKTTFVNRLAAGKACGDILLFDVTKPKEVTQNCQFIPSKTPADFRVTLVRAIYDGVNGVSRLSIDTSRPPAATQGSAYSTTLAASDGSTPYTWSITAGALPAGLSLAGSTGVISGTPTAATGTTPTFTVTDNLGKTASKPVQIAISSTLAISTASLPGATQGTAYTTTLAATGGTSPYTWAATTALPAGLSLSTGGVLSGTPAAAGTTSITFKVTDSVGTAVTKTLNLTVTASGGTQQTVTLGAGTTSWTVPTNVTTLDSLEIWGAGASGAGPGTTTGQAGGGGGGGGYAKWNTLAVTAGAVLTVVIGAGGGRKHGSIGADGGASSIVIAATAYAANGGVHGLSGTNLAGGAGGAGGATTTTPAPAATFSGGAGAAGTPATGPAGGGGSSAGTAANGSNGSAGTGGAVPIGGAAGGSGGTSSAQSGGDGGSPGGGGGGGFWDGTVPENSGAGGPGQIIVKYTPSTSGPAVTTTTLPDATQGAGYSQALAAAGGTLPYSWTVVTGALPAGLTLAAGMVTSLLDESGAVITDEGGTVQPATLALSPAVPGQAVPGQTVPGQVAPATATPGSAGVAITDEGSAGSSGVISGTPTGSGTSAFTVQVTDGGGLTATAQLSITVGTSLVVTTDALPAGNAGQAYTAQLTAAGGTLPYSWALTSGSLPPGVGLGSGGDLSGSTSTAGTYTATFTVTDALGAAAAASLTITVSAPVTSMFPLGVTVQLLINGTWADISQFVYTRDQITITGGRQDEGGTAQPATLNLTLNNRDGRFSPNYTGGAYFPYLTRNVRIQVGVAATSSSGNFYSGWRFTGEVATWPPLSDLSGNDVYVQITASGPLRRLRSGGGKGSALTRYYASLSGPYAPVAYWPAEEDPDTSVIGAGVAGGQDMAISNGTPKWKAVSAFNGSAPIGVLNRSTWDGFTGTYGSGSGNDVYGAVPGTYTWVCPAGITSVDCRVTGGGGGGSNGSFQNQAGGRGGEFAQEAALAVTPGQAYSVVVGAGGQGANGGASGATGGNGRVSSFAGDVVTVLGHGGGQAGTSSNTVHHAGGAGGTHTGGGSGGGGGGGGSGGLTAAGNAGASTATNTGAAGATAVSGGAAGGRGGDNGNNPTQGNPGGTPGGGGGGGGHNAKTGYEWQGGNGGPGQVQLIYAPVTVPNTNVIRFVLWTPPWGGNDGGVLIRAITSSATFAKLEVVYFKGGKLTLRGYSNLNVKQFDSGAQDWNIDGRTVMVSAELANTPGGNITWKLRVIHPGDSSVLGSKTGTTSGAAGNVTEILAGPNADITKSAIGHISLQYALVDLTKVSKAVAGHDGEMSVDRFIRLANEAALDNQTEFAETQDHWGFEDGTTQGWSSTHGTATNSTAWSSPVDGQLSLLLTADGSGSPQATGPAGLSGQPISPGDRVSAAADLYAPAPLNNVYAGIQFFDATGAFLSEADSTDAVLVPFITVGGVAPDQQRDTFTVSATAPKTAAYFAVAAGNHGTVPAGTQLYIDHVRAHPRMGPQTRDEYHKLLEHIEDLDQGIMHEARELHGFHYRTRLNLINQAPGVTLDYAAAMLSPELAPVIDDQHIKNHITVHRHKGSKVQVTLNDGALSIQEPPYGAGRYHKHVRVHANEDVQLLAYAAHLLNLGTVTDERYPTITVDLTRAALPGSSLAPLMSVVASLEIGDLVSLVNLPFFFPSSTTNQLIIGYTETISANPPQWTLTLNCAPASPWTITATSLRRW